MCLKMEYNGIVVIIIFYDIDMMLYNEFILVFRSILSGYNSIIYSVNYDIFRYGIIVVVV